jgi:hypothetical protein
MLNLFQHLPKALKQVQGDVIVGWAGFPSGNWFRQEEVLRM